MGYNSIRIIFTYTTTPLQTTDFGTLLTTLFFSFWSLILSPNHQLYFMSLFPNKNIVAVVII